MAPTLHLVRHAQGWHNLSVENESMHDPELTPFGQQQCAQLRESFPYQSQLTTLVASPMRRTIFTADLSFGRPDLLPITLLDTLQELADLPSDTGSEPEQLTEEFGDKIDLTNVRRGWNSKLDASSPFEPTLEKIVARAKASRRFLRDLASQLDDDAHIVVVSHGAFLHWLSDEWQDIPMPYPTNWSNCEYRSYQFVDLKGSDEEAQIRETDG
ncbi:hypothetical protein Golomagni_07277, partial [Golovinomyces magnicellulatus]